ncbi:hypothetical protein LCGC14_2431110 [marine sediment metagenome]|uniref:Uncharacterized protein n=1 Tax=marine sediment metagenome TaxID=412755 RepID=A0A0F9DYW3_9ZZZZ
MREQFKNVGVVLALIIAGFSLPTSIMSLTSKAATPITEVDNYYYYNNTVIERFNDTIIVIVNNTVIVNETVVYEEPIQDRSKPVEEHYFRINSTNPHYIINYTIGKNEVYQFLQKAYPLRAITYPRITVVQSIWIDVFIDSGYKDGDFYAPGGGGNGMWTPPYLDNWYIVIYYDSGMPYLANNWDWGLNDSLTTII